MISEYFNLLDSFIGVPPSQYDWIRVTAYICIFIAFIKACIGGFNDYK